MIKKQCATGLQNIAFNVVCPHCGEIISKQLAHLKRNSNVICHACHVCFIFNAKDLKRAIAHSDGSLGSIRGLVDGMVIGYG